MSKELPYFKFFPDQWLGKKISLESYELQGLFMCVCSIYWINDCTIKMETLHKRYGEAISLLIAGLYIKEDSKGMAKITFLDEQFNLRLKTHKELSNSGKAGAKARWAKHSEANGEAISHPNGEANGYKIREEKKRKENELKKWMGYVE